MKKLLITTSLATLFAANVFADAHMDKGPFDIKFTGSINAQVASNLTRKKAMPSITPNNKKVAMDSEVQLAVDLKAKTAKGLTYGAHIGIAANTLATLNNAKHLSNRTFIFTECRDMGRLELGSNMGAADMMMVGAGSIAAGTGGIIGDWSKYVVLPNVANGDFIVNPVLPLDNITLYNTIQNTGSVTASSIYYSLMGHAHAEKARKITYLTPIFDGVQAGISYIPDASNLGLLYSLPNSQSANGFEKDAFTGGVWWNGHASQGQHVKVSLTGNYGKISTPSAGANTFDASPAHTTKALAIGAEWSSHQFAAAGSFGWLGKTSVVDAALTGSRLKASNSWYATAGVGIKADKLYTSLTGSWTNSPLKNRMWNTSLGANYEVAPGFLPYAELTYVNFQQKATGAVNPEGVDFVKAGAAASSKNTALILILGTKVKF